MGSLSVELAPFENDHDQEFPPIEELINLNCVLIQTVSATIKLAVGFPMFPFLVLVCEHPPSSVTVNEILIGPSAL